jgi:hypothetical protein
MVDGFWILQVQIPEFTSGGVAVFIGGKVFGGDNGFTWIGTYEEGNRLVKARVNVHNFDPAVQSVFGIKGDYELHFSGNVQGYVITGSAILASQPQKTLGIRLTKKANL